MIGLPLDDGCLAYSLTIFSSYFSPELYHWLAGSGCYDFWSSLCCGSGDRASYSSIWYRMLSDNFTISDFWDVWSFPVQALNLRKEINNDFSILVDILLHLHVVHTAQKDWHCSGIGQDARFPRFWFPPIYSCYGQRNFTVSPRCVFPLWISLLAPV